MNKKYKIIITLIIALVLTAVIIPMTGCKSGGGNGDNKISEIYIAKSDLPRVSYVEGQSLDLEKGKLTVVEGGNESKVPLTAPEVSITGYDKDVIGEQTLTVTYSGLTTTFKVTVAARTVAEKYETKYFVGDSFKADMGKIKITTDDAKTFYVNMNDEKVSVVTFDTSKAGTSTVTLLYNDGTNSYYTQFDVTVYEMSNVEFTAPTKTNYLSHDDALSITGGFFKVTSSDGTLTMNVPLTEDMVTGFDLSAATVENRKTPYEQKLTVTYLEKTFEYTVNITFSGISTINYYANGELANIDWNKATTDGLTEKVEEAALTAITEYYNLSDADKALISEEVKSLIGRAGTVAVAKLFYTELETYGKTFALSANGGIAFANTTYEQTKADTERLNDLDSDLNNYADLLRTIVAEFGEVILVEDVTIKSFAIVYSAETEELLRQVLNHLINVFSLLKDIPENWTAETLKPFGDNILSATMQIYNAGYYKAGNTSYYSKLLSTWRTNNDVFDIIYTYFLYDYENGDEFMINYMWGNMPLPGILEEWYRGLSNAIYYSNYYKNYGSTLALTDLSSYMYNYYHTLEICEEIKNSDNTFLKDIYNIYNGDYMNRVYMYTYTCGYLYHMNAMIDSPAVTELWAKYYEVLKHYNDKTLDSAQHKEQICAMFDAFEDLTPTELLGFLSSMSLLYTSGGGKYPMLGYTKPEGSDSNVVYNVFSSVLSNNFGSYLNAANKPLLNDLLSAMETFALIGYKDGAYEEFNAKMKALSEAVAALSAEDSANFREYLGTGYDKYFAIYEISSGKVAPTLTDEETLLANELKDILNKYIVVYSAIYSLSQNGQTVPADAYPILYALYARASELRNTLLNSGSTNAVLYMYSLEQDFTLTSESVLKYTLEKAYYLSDSFTTSLLNNMSATLSTGDGTVSYVTYWDLYKSNGIEKLLSDNCYLLYAAYFEDGKSVDHAAYLALLAEMRTYETLKMSIIVLFNIDDTVYRSLSVYYKNVANFSEEALSVNQELIFAEMAYNQYMIGNKTDADNRLTFKNAMKSVSEAYAKLTDAEKEYISVMYNYYLTIWKQFEAEDAEAAA